MVPAEHKPCVLTTPNAWSDAVPSCLQCSDDISQKMVQSKSYPCAFNVKAEGAAWTNVELQHVFNKHLWWLSVLMQADDVPLGYEPLCCGVGMHFWCQIKPWEIYLQCGFPGECLLDAVSQRCLRLHSGSICLFWFQSSFTWSQGQVWPFFFFIYTLRLCTIMQIYTVSTVLTSVTKL